MKIALALLFIATSLNAAVPTYDGESASADAHSTPVPITPFAPSSLSVGDLDVMVAITEFGSTLSIPTAGGGAWTALSVSPANGTTANGAPLYIWWRISASGDSDPTVAQTADFAFGWRFAIAAGTFDAASPIEIPNAGVDNVLGQSYSYTPGTSTTGPDRLVFAIASSSADFSNLQIPAQTNSSLTSVSNTAYNNTAQGGGGGAQACRGALATAGSIGTFTSSAWASNSKKNYISFAIKPAAATTPNPGAFLQMF